MKVIQYIINGANGILNLRNMRMAIKYIQVLSTNTLQAIPGVHVDVCLVGMAMILNVKIELELQKEGVSMKYVGTCLPEIHVSRHIPHEPSGDQRYRLVDVPEAMEMLKSVIVYRFFSIICMFIFK